MKNVLVTGVSSGIGLSLAERNLAEGHRVYGIQPSRIPNAGNTREING